MRTTNIRHILEPVADFHVMTKIRPSLRRGSPIDYVKANQRCWIEIRFNSELDPAIFEKAVKGSTVRLAEWKGRFFITAVRLNFFEGE